MGRPRKLRPAPKPVGRPRKVPTAADKLAALSASELKALQAYNDGVVNAPMNGRHKQGDVRADGKIFLWYQPIWVSPAAFKRYKARMKSWYQKKYLASGSDSLESNNNPDQNQQDTPKETLENSKKPE